ncbi:flavodoxin domain-containing protein [Colwellia asteriadis]
MLLKVCAYFYLMTGISLALFTLHWQSSTFDFSAVRPERTFMTQPVVSEHHEVVKTFHLAPNARFQIKHKDNQLWLTIVKNNEIHNQFSSRETAAILTLKILYNIMLVLCLLGLTSLLLTCQRKAFKLKTLLVISAVLFSQALLPWSGFYSFIITKLFWPIGGGVTYYIATEHLFYFMVISVATLCYIPSLVRQYQQSLLGQAQDDNRNHSLIAYASQSGTAAAIAKSIAKQLPSTSRYHITCVSSLQAQQLSNYQQVLLLASTYGDGEPPELARGFISSLHQLEHSLSTVKYSVLAFGDKQYPQYCAFGHQLCAILREKGAQALMPVTEINQGNQVSIQLWWQQLTNVLGWHNSTLEKSWQQQSVISNTCLNPHSTSRHAHHISLMAQEHDFSPGDLVEVLPRQSATAIENKLLRCGWAPSTIVTHHNQSRSLLAALQQLNWQHEQADTPQALVDKLPELSARTYSIASCADQGVIDLLVRQVVKADNSVGLCSGYLAQLSAQDTLTMVIKKHHHFHPPSVQTPIIMIAAGTGLAPFIGFLEQRLRATKCADAWLIMGERDAQHDNYFDQQLTCFEQQSCLHKRQHAWSQSSESSAHKAKYVDEIIIAEQVEIRQWLLKQNAQLYLCGNASTLGASCDAALADILGANIFKRLKQQQQIKYDLY